MGTVATVSVSMVSTILSVVTACVSRSRCTTLSVLSVILTVLPVTLSWWEHFRMVLLVLFCTFHAVAADGIPEASGLIVGKTVPEFLTFPDYVVLLCKHAE